MALRRRQARPLSRAARRAGGDRGRHPDRARQPPLECRRIHRRDGWSAHRRDAPALRRRARAAAGGTGGAAAVAAAPGEPARPRTRRGLLCVPRSRAPPARVDGGAAARALPARPAPAACRRARARAGARRPRPRAPRRVPAMPARRAGWSCSGSCAAPSAGGSASRRSTVCTSRGRWCSSATARPYWLHWRATCCAGWTATSSTAGERCGSSPSSESAGRRSWCWARCPSR